MTRLKAAVPLLFVFIFLAAAPGHGLELYQARLSPETGPFYIIYAEDDRWMVDVVALDARAWPQLEQRRIFARESAARAYLAELRHLRAMTPVQEFAVDGRPLTAFTSAPLWTVRHKWDWNWELKFADWVKTELDVSWWKRHGLATDCADVEYSARWIFARNNGLPMTNHLATGQWFTENSVKPEWDRLPTATEWDKDKRFLAALNYLLELTYTHTLWRDSYPVEITKRAILPGGHHLHLRQDTGHTQFIYGVGSKPDEVPVLTFNSTVPRDLRDMMEFVFSEYGADAGGNGFLRMRWPTTVNGAPELVPGDQMPYYSLEQFDPNFAGGRAFWEAVFDRLNPNADFNVIGAKIVTQVLDSFNLRIAVVEKGYQKCSAKPCVPDSPEWEAWSTPTRDARISTSVTTYDEVSYRMSDWSKVQPLMDSKVLSLDGTDYKLSELMDIWRMQGYSSDPNDTPRIRWGVDSL